MDAAASMAPATWLCAPTTRSAPALAQRAAYLDPSPHVMDTLAECYFVNGDIDAAIRSSLGLEPG